MKLHNGKAIAMARRTIARVDARAPTCPRPQCRRHGHCTANPYRYRNSRDGGCPVTARAEWGLINFGIHLAMTRAFAAIDAARGKSGETFQAAFARMLIPGPVTKWDRRGMIRPLRREAGDDRQRGRETRG